MIMTVLFTLCIVRYAPCTFENRLLSNGFSLNNNGAVSASVLTLLFALLLAFLLAVAFALVALAITACHSAQSDSSDEHHLFHTKKNVLIVQ